MGAEVQSLRQPRPAKRQGTRPRSFYCEDPRTQYLLIGTDELGRKVYFFKMNVTGLRGRMFGPYATRSVAIRCFDKLLLEMLEAFCEVTNMDGAAKHAMSHIALPEDLMPVDVVEV